MRALSPSLFWRWVCARLVRADAPPSADRPRGRYPQFRFGGIAETFSAGRVLIETYDCLPLQMHTSTATPPMPTRAKAPSLRFFIVAAGSLVVANTLAAQGQQEPTPARLTHSVSVVAGVSQWDLSGAGTSPITGLRVDTELRRWLVGEAALGLFRPDEQFSQNNTYIIPEVMVQLQIPTRVFRPYIGVGTGTFSGGGRGNSLTVAGATGFRISVPNTRVDVKAELRARAIEQSLSASAAEWTFGGGYRF